VTFTDFQAALKNIKNNAVPSPSGLTANMVKSSSAATKCVVYDYDYMNNLWLTDTPSPKKSVHINEHAHAQSDGQRICRQSCYPHL
jgi:hypothetical protein